MNADVERAADRLARLIPELEFGRETHVQWRDCDQCWRDANPNIGDPAFHDSAVKDYDERLAAVKQAMRALRDQDVEIARLKDALRQAHKDYGFEIRDPNGTIWEACDSLQKENERLRKEQKCRHMFGAAGTVLAATSAAMPTRGTTYD